MMACRNHRRRCEALPTRRTNPSGHRSNMARNDRPLRSNLRHCRMASDAESCNHPCRYHRIRGNCSRSRVQSTRSLRPNFRCSMMDQCCTRLSSTLHLGSPRFRDAHRSNCRRMDMATTTAARRVHARLARNLNSNLHRSTLDLLGRRSCNMSHLHNPDSRATHRMVRFLGIRRRSRTHPWQHARILRSNQSCSRSDRANTPQCSRARLSNQDCRESQAVSQRRGSC